MNITYHTNYFLILINYHLYRDSFINLARYAYKDTNYQLSHQLISNIHLSFNSSEWIWSIAQVGQFFFFFDFKTLGKKKFLQLNCSLVQESVNEVKLVVFSSFYVPNNNINYGTIQCIKNGIIILIAIIFELDYLLMISNIYVNQILHQLIDIVVDQRVKIIFTFRVWFNILFDPHYLNNIIFHPSFLNKNSKHPFVNLLLFYCIIPLTFCKFFSAIFASLSYS